MLDEPWPQLRRLALALEPSGIVWRLGGSGLQAALGVTDEVGDLDIAVHADVLDEVLVALESFGLQVLDAPAPWPWCSDWLARGRLDGVDVEVIGGFCVRAGSRRVPVPLDLGGHLDLEGVTIPLADPAAWWWVYANYRPASAQRLAAVIEPDRLTAIVERLGPPEPPAGHR